MKKLVVLTLLMLISLNANAARLFLGAGNETIEGSISGYFPQSDFGLRFSLLAKEEEMEGIYQNYTEQSVITSFGAIYSIKHHSKFYVEGNIGLTSEDYPPHDRNSTGIVIGATAGMKLFKEVSLNCSIQGYTTLEEITGVCGGSLYFY